mmetsp:Transcript_36032/g.116355  ORF Transcript_36032/g.116355 Transcript_36032/m.116355 type:complete len:205 (-) Transcript_36032:117-731(-)
MQVVGGGDESPVRRLLRELAGRLGGEYVGSSSYDPRCRHVVVVNVKRTEKLLAGLAAGAWLLKPSWAEASAAAGAWLPEEAHELFSAGEATAPCGRGLLWLGAPRAHRLARPQRGGGVFVGQTFSLAPEVVPPPAQLRRIIEAGGGGVLEQGAPLRVGAIAVVPDGADASHPLAQEAMRAQASRVGPNELLGRLVGLGVASLAG